MTFDGCKSINTGFKRKVNRAKKTCKEMLEMPVSLLGEVSEALDYMIRWKMDMELPWWREVKELRVEQNEQN